MSQLDSLLDELGRHEIPVAEEAPIDFDALFPRRNLFRRGSFEAKKPFKKETFYALGEIKPKRAGDMMVGASLPPAYTGQTEPEEAPKFAETPSSSILMNLMDYSSILFYLSLEQPQLDENFQSQYIESSQLYF